MKKLIARAPVILVMCFSFLPVCSLVGLAAGYRLELRFGNELITLFGLFSMLVLLELPEYPPEMDRGNVFLSTVLFPLSFATGMITVDGCRSFPAVLFSTACIFCAAAFLKRCACKDNIRFLYRLLTVMMTVLFLLYSLIFCVFGGFLGVGSHEITSPGEVYTAQILQSGENCIIEVTEPGRDIDLILFRYADAPQRIELPLDSSKAQIAFTDDTTLTVNGIDYIIR